MVPDRFKPELLLLLPDMVHVDEHTDVADEMLKCLTCGLGYRFVFEKSLELPATVAMSMLQFDESFNEVMLAILLAVRSC